jgi:hypothetical protein
MKNHFPEYFPRDNLKNLDFARQYNEILPLMKKVCLTEGFAK